MLTFSTLRAVSSLLAISCTALREGANPCKSRSSIYLITTFSLSLVSFFKLGLQSRRAGLLAS